MTCPQRILQRTKVSSTCILFSSIIYSYLRRNLQSWRPLRILIFAIRKRQQYLQQIWIFYNLWPIGILDISNYEFCLSSNMFSFTKCFNLQIHVDILCVRDLANAIISCPVWAKIYWNRYHKVPHMSHFGTFWHNFELPWQPCLYTTAVRLKWDKAIAIMRV